MKHDNGFPHTFETVPALRWIRLERIGCWKELEMEFLPGLNIISGENGSGKSLVLQAIVQAVHPSSSMGYPVSATRGHQEGAISIELVSPSIKLRVVGPRKAPSPPSLCAEPMGRRLLNDLHSQIETTPPDTALLIDDATAVFDRPLFDQAVRLLNAARCQVICVISHLLDPQDFKRARIFKCSRDQENDCSNMRLMQSGGDASVL